MNMSTWAIRNPVPPIALFLVLCVLGLISFFRMPVTEMPNVDLPMISVSVDLPGADPAEIVSQVIRPIEAQIGDAAGVRHVSAKAADGTASLTVDFVVGTNTERALNDVKDAVTRARDDIPEGIGEPVVRRLDVEGGAILTYAVADQTRSIEGLSAFVDDVITPELQAIKGVGGVVRMGGTDREIDVELVPDRLLAFGVTVAEINAQLTRMNVDLGSGSGQFASQAYSIRATGSAESVDALAATPIRLASGDTVQLDALGAVTEDAATPERFALLDGKPVVAFAVFRATGASDLAAAEATKERLAHLSQTHPNAHFTLIDDATVFTAANYDAAMDTLYEGAVLAIVVVFLFLRDWRATLVAFVSLPLSAIPTFAVMDLLGFSLNTLSLLGITLVVGVLVDDAIVEIENIERHMRSGRPAFQAAEEAASEIGMTVIAISLTIVAVFTPVVFMGGVAGQYFGQFGITVAVAVLFSLLVARLITPMFAAYFLKSRGDAGEAKDGRLMRFYLRLLGWTLRHRFVTLALGGLIFAGSIYSSTLLPTEFAPSSDIGRAIVTIQLPPGSRPIDARRVAERATALVSDVPEVRSVFVDGVSATDLTVRINYGQRHERDRPGRAIDAAIEDRLAAIPDTRFFVAGGNAGRDVSVNVLGDTEAATSTAAQALARAIGPLPELRNVSTTAALMRPEVRITPMPERAAELGVSTAALAETIRLATLGDADANLPQFNAGETRIPIRVRLEEAARDDLTRLSELRVLSASGEQVPIGAVAEAHLTRGPSTIERYDRRYRVAVEGDLAGGAVLGPAMDAVMQAADRIDRPEGTSVRAAGDAEFMEEVFASFMVAMGTGVLFVYVVLVLLFASFLTPITILLSLPLAIGGAIFALALYGAGLGLPVVIGVLMLIGIVAKNAIMLVEFAFQAVEAGAGRVPAVIDAAHKRARPIIMTTVAMSAGMVPSMLTRATGGEFRAPMAVVVIGGLLLSTLLSLLFVPSLFIVVESLKDWSRKGLAWVLGSDHHPATGGGTETTAATPP
ncbi:efflux RND transporter permease subunit [Jiella pacifica]|uniref:MMPL family transporter n=1 Tax=Jiella pacifica TaxID=2696469 RepID=A0A6N9T615_9HYPH|nr:efflux RND transporter permease subunit [Jiella pacifica]NDW06837.1 MMPL family transporter [Jiella pacifica]